MQQRHVIRQIRLKKLNSSDEKIKAILAKLLLYIRGHNQILWKQCFSLCSHMYFVQRFYVPVICNIDINIFWGVTWWQLYLPDLIFEPYLTLSFLCSTFIKVLKLKLKNSRVAHNSQSFHILQKTAEWPIIPKVFIFRKVHLHLAPYFVKNT